MSIARTGVFSPTLVGNWLDYIVGGTIPTYMALFTSDPHAAGNPLYVEVVSPKYVRVPVTGTWTRSGNLLTCTSTMLWASLPEGLVVTHIGAFNAGVNGDFLFAGPIPGVLGYYSFPDGGYLQVAPNSFHVGIDV